MSTLPLSATPPSATPPSATPPSATPAHDPAPGRERLLERSARLEVQLANLYLVYQPVVRARTGCVVGFEVLLRSACLSFRGAGSLVRLARELGRTSEVDERVRALLATEFEQARHWRTFFVNQDVEELNAGALGSERDALLPYASRVVVDLVGWETLGDAEATREAVDRLRQRGYRVALGGEEGDDPDPDRWQFLRPAVYKLPGGLVRQAHLDAARRERMATLIQQAHRQGALVVAQGIERAEERDTAVHLGCDLLQGFFLGIPRISLDG